MIRTYSMATHYIGRTKIILWTHKVTAYPYLSRLPWIFLGARLKFNGAPRYIQGNLDRYIWMYILPLWASYRVSIWSILDNIDHVINWVGLLKNLYKTITCPEGWQWTYDHFSLTYWGLNKITKIWQTLSNEFSWMKSSISWFKIQWSFN